jgi:hypothetical protein
VKDTIDDVAELVTNVKDTTDDVAELVSEYIQHKTLLDAIYLADETFSDEISDIVMRFARQLLSL